MPIGIRSLTLAMSAGIFSVACGGAATPQPATAKDATQPAPTTTVAKEEPPPIPVAAPEVEKAPASCDAFVKDVPAAKPKDPSCADASAVLATLAAAAIADKKGDHAARDAALSSLSTCEKVPTLIPETLRAELAPIQCAEAILAPALDAKGKEAFPPHLAAARALVGASRLSRLRPKKGAFDILARAEVDPKAAAQGIEYAKAWKAALEKEEADAIALTKNAPAEIVAIVSFEIAAAYLAVAKETRSTPFPEEAKPLLKKDPDLEVKYYAKLDEVTMPLVVHARETAYGGLGRARTDGIHVKPLPHFQQIVDPFKSRPLFENKPTRELELLAPDPLAKEPKDAVKLAAQLPPWAVYALLERTAPASLLDPQVLLALATQRGIPAALRREAEPNPKAKPDPKLAKDNDARMSAITIARVRTALAYGTRSDAEAVASWTPKDANDQLRVAIAKALLGAKQAIAKPGTPEATQPPAGFDLAPLDALAKKGGAVGQAAQYNAALLALDAAQTFGGAPTDPLQTTTDPRKAYEDAIARLDAFASAKGADPARAANAKKLADSARETVKLLNTKTPPAKKS